MFPSIEILFVSTQVTGHPPGSSLAFAFSVSLLGGKGVGEVGRLGKVGACEAGVLLSIEVSNAISNDTHPHSRCARLRDKEVRFRKTLTRCRTRMGLLCNIKVGRKERKLHRNTFAPASLFANTSPVKK